MLRRGDLDGHPPGWERGHGPCCEQNERTAHPTYRHEGPLIGINRRCLTVSP